MSNSNIEETEKSTTVSLGWEDRLLFQEDKGEGLFWALEERARHRKASKIYTRNTVVPHLRSDLGMHSLKLHETKWGEQALEEECSGLIKILQKYHF